MDLLADAHPRGHAFVPSNVLLLVAPARRPMFRQPEFSRAFVKARAKGKGFRMGGKVGISRRGLVIAGAAVGTSFKLVAQDRGDPVEIADSETATIDGRIWDKPIVGGKTVDAVHRSVLLRFPAMAEPIAAKLAKGYAVARAELVLAYEGYEIVPPEYTCRVGLGQKVWTENPPTWHIQAWPLRRPWIADPLLGPTFNANVNGRRYWSQYGAVNGNGDRYSPLEAQELSIGKPEARIDISRLFLTDMLAQEPAMRLRSLEQRGFLLHKIETYDSRYRVSGDVYEWAMPTGGHGLRFAAPRLAIVCKPLAKGNTVAVALPRSLPRDELIRPSDDARRPRSPASLGKRAHRRTAANRGRPGEPLGGHQRPQGLRDLPGADPRIARYTAALLAGLGNPGRPAHQSRIRRPASGAGAGSSQGLLVDLADARFADR
jgi:hypothetical protein